MKRLGILLVLLLAEITFFTAISGNNFHSASDLAIYLRSYSADLVAQAAPTLLLAFGMTLVLMTAGIDLSVGSMVALICCVLSCFPAGKQFWWTALPAGLGVGLLACGLNALLIALLDVPPIIATLGTMIFFRGLCFVIMGDLENSPFLEVPGYERLGVLPGSALLVGAVFLVGGVYLAHSVWRRHLLMMGGNRTAARYAAIPVERRLSEVYVLVGVLAFLAALTFTARNGSVTASSLSGMELRVIVAVVLGGTPVQGGRGTILGTIFGVLFIAVLDEGLRGAAVWGTRHLPFRISHLEYLLLGLLLVFGVTLNTFLQARTAERANR
jgi:ribose/xylose/arabinose/galactoside ABC-type transport system permease subunit